MNLAPEKKFDELQDSFVLQRYVLPNEVQAKNYRQNFANITPSGESLYLYPNCELLSKYTSYNTPGDDCTRFAFAVLELGMNKETTELVNISIDANQFCKNNKNDADTIEKMKREFNVYSGKEMLQQLKFDEKGKYISGLMDGDMLVGSKEDGNTRNHCEFVYNSSKVNPIMFGWGSVKGSIVHKQVFQKGIIALLMNLMKILSIQYYIGRSDKYD